MREDVGIRRGAGLDILCLERSDTSVGDVELRALRNSCPTFIDSPHIPRLFHIQDGICETLNISCLLLFIAGSGNILTSTHILVLVMHLFNSKHKQNDLIAHDTKFYTTFNISNYKVVLC